MASTGRVYIIGFMGSGKSTAGKELAYALGWYFLDLDEEIESKAGKSIKDIFSEHGEEHFRQMESNILMGLETDKDSVISAGGGTPCFGSNMDFMLKTGLVVYLKMTPAQLKSRLENSLHNRPLINNIGEADLLPYITTKLSEREKHYLRAPIIIDVISLDIKVLAEMIRTRLPEKVQ
jgi:shikimate kinase